MEAVTICMHAVRSNVVEVTRVLLVLHLTERGDHVGSRKGRTLAFDGDESTLWLTEETVSTLHAKFVTQSNTHRRGRSAGQKFVVAIVDLGSKNGTKVGTKKIAKHRSVGLKKGTTIFFADMEVRVKSITKVC